MYVRPIFRDDRLRLFQQMHQDDDPVWHRASGGSVCSICGLEYRQHPQEEYINIDHRLCDGRIVHL